MNSAVLKLQEEALSRDIGVSDLLRKALVISKKLRLSDFEQWTQLGRAWITQEFCRSSA
jgi:hypothetical protein